MHDPLSEWQKVWWTIRYRAGSLLLLTVLIVVLVVSLVWLLRSDKQPDLTPNLATALVDRVMVAEAQVAQPTASGSPGRRDPWHAD